ncbi:hypothetical protein E2P81_ATG00235 [Venturia nashicola]|nr:hypothetical protein E2P81_ATG00235 [Venturia nashicola]
MSQKVNATKAKQTKRNKEIIEELAATSRALTKAKSQVIKITETEKALADARARIAELEKEKIVVQSQKRPREDDSEVAPGESAGRNDGELDASKMFRQSLKRPRTSEASNTGPS